MKKLIFAMLCVVIVLPLLAQSPNLNVKLDASAMRAVQSQRTVTEKWGYTVCIYADNGQNARYEASRYLSKIRSLLPYEPSRLEYENPFFKVYVGECYDRSEAVRLIGLIKGVFPKSVISVKEFSLQTFAEFRENPLFVVDTTEVDSLKLSEMFDEEDPEELEFSQL